MCRCALLTAISVAFGVLFAPAHAASGNCNRNVNGISVPAGFCIEVYARDVGALRHIAVSAIGTVYAALSAPQPTGGIAVLGDTNGDGQADSVHYFGDVSGTGIALHGGDLYFAETTRILRFALSPKTGLPQGEPQAVVTGLPRQRQHSARGMAFDQAGHVYVNIGAPSNACQQRDRRPRSRGIDPCPLLEEHGGIWRFDADKTGQTFSADQRYASGLRNTLALAWNALAGALYGVMMGRDQLHGNWPEIYTVKESSELPAEEFIRIEQGDNFGWPYCYYDGKRGKLMLAPEYGGEGEKVGRCKQFEWPLVAFPAHWSPEAIVFYEAEAFPQKYLGGAFIAFHGSWNRAPLPQQGFVVAFVPFEHGKPSGGWQIFAQGFAGADELSSPGQARFRPVGVAIGPHGALYIADSQRGRIWRVTWEGNAGAKNQK